MPKRRANRGTVPGALTNHNWIQDVQGATSVVVLTEYLNLWDILSDCELQPGVPGTHCWKLASSVQYSAKSAYEAFFQGSVLFRALGIYMEDLGSKQMQILSLASGT